MCAASRGQFRDLMLSRIADVVPHVQAAGAVRHASRGGIHDRIDALQQAAARDGALDVPADRPLYADSLRRAHARIVPRETIHFHLIALAHFEFGPRCRRRESTRPDLENGEKRKYSSSMSRSGIR